MENKLVEIELVKKLLKPIIEEAEYTLFDVKIISEEESLILQIIIDKQNLITLEDCVKVTNLINPILDENENMFKEKYILDVCSKGTEE